MTEVEKALAVARAAKAEKHVFVAAAYVIQAAEAPTGVEPIRSVFFVCKGNTARMIQEGRMPGCCEIVLS